MVLRIPGHGMASDEPGGPNGYFYVVVRTAPDSQFECDREDLWRTVTVSVAGAAPGY